MFTSEVDPERDDWALVRHAAVSLFRRPEAPEEARAALAALRYDIATVACHAGEAAFHAGVSAALCWEAQFGLGGWSGHLDALNDGFRGHQPSCSACRNFARAAHGVALLPRWWEPAACPVPEPEPNPGRGDRACSSLGSTSLSPARQPQLCAGNRT